MSTKSAKSEILHVGIDLGTSRSSISASNGARHVVESYVGWPVDMVARKSRQEADSLRRTRRSRIGRCSISTARSSAG